MLVSVRRSFFCLSINPGDRRDLHRFDLHQGRCERRLTEKFFEPPLYSRRVGFITVYTAVYLPAEGRVDCLWPGERWSQRLNHFVAAEYTHDYRELLS